MKLNASNSNRSTLVLVALLAFCLVAANIWSISKMLASQSALSEASNDLLTNQKLIAKIKELQDRPRIASIAEETPIGIKQRIEQAMKGSAIPSDKKISDIPMLQLLPKGTNYKERRTEIKMVELSMPQIIQFCQQLEDPEKGLTVRDLDLKASKPTTVAPSDLWDATITLSQLIYFAPGTSL